MKLCLLLLSFLFIVSCKKSTDLSNPTTPEPVIPEIVIPAPSPITSSLVLYVLDNSQNINPLDVNTNLTHYNYSSSLFHYSIPSITTDKYITKISAQETLTSINVGFRHLKVVTATSSLKNYSTLKYLPLVLAGAVNDVNVPHTFALPNGGEISLPAQPFLPNSLDMPADIYTNYYHPALTDYAVSIPCYPMADDDNKRSFLNSFGIYLIHPFGDENRVKINPAREIVLKLPIASAQQNIAPDSIAVWYIMDDGVWQKEGYARKINNHYVKNINKRGFWNFAQTVKGLYLNLNIIATTGGPLANVRYKILNGNYEVADARTDAEGNSLVFLPEDQNLSIQIINDHNNNAWLPAVMNQPLGTYNSSMQKTITVPVRSDIASIDGRVYNCDGTDFGNGTAILKGSRFKDDYLIPIKNGVIKLGIWMLYGASPMNLEIRDNSGAVLNTYLLAPGGDDIRALATERLFHMKFYTCTDAPKLYCNYKLDGVEHSVNSDIQNPAITVTDYPSLQDILQINGPGGSIMLQGYLRSILGNYLSTGGINLPTGIKVNGEVCTIASRDDGGFELLITRRDANAGGIVEGWFNIFYRDSNNALHNISGNFRGKKLN